MKPAVFINFPWHKAAKTAYLTVGRAFFLQRPDSAAEMMELADDARHDEEAFLFVALKGTERLYAAALLPVMIYTSTNEALLRDVSALPQVLHFPLKTVLLEGIGLICCLLCSC